jgi:hypothetical protein
MASTLPYGTPLVDKARRFTVWRIEELYTGPTGEGQVFPNNDDLVIDYTTGQFLRVIDADYTNYSYRFKNFTPTSTENETEITGSCGYFSPDTFRVYVDDSKHPATLHTDASLRWPGSDNDCIRIFKGVDISTDNAVVISGYYVNGRLVSDTIPLTLAAVNNVTNVTIKSPLPGVCTKPIDDGELVTVVVYTDAGVPSLIRRCHVVKTNLVMALENPSRQITDVKLISPFISPEDDRLLVLPTNIPLEDIPLHAEVRYTDGSRRVTIDGTRAILHGLRNSGSHDTFYISSNVGQTMPLTLSYHMGRNETYAGDDVVDGVINKAYGATTLEVDGAYSVKLYVVPQWLDVERGYRLHYYLYSLERGNVFDATPYVYPAVNSPVFDPKLYGVKQRLAVNVDLSKVSPTYNAHIHPQSFHISLLSPGYAQQDNFIIHYVHDQPGVGDDCFALFHYDNVTHWMLDVTCGAKDKAEWLQRLYTQAYPLYDRRTEATPPEPTHFEVIVGGKSYLKLINEWVAPFHVDFQVNEADTVILRWIRRTPNDDLQLGLTPMLAHQRP